MIDKGDISASYRVVVANQRGASVLSPKSVELCAPTHKSTAPCVCKYQSTRVVQVRFGLNVCSYNSMTSSTLRYRAVSMYAKSSSFSDKTATDDPVNHRQSTQQTVKLHVRYRAPTLAQTRRNRLGSAQTSTNRRSTNQIHHRAQALATRRLQSTRIQICVDASRTT